MFWGVLVGLQARLCKSRGVSTERQSGHLRDTSCGAHVTAFHTLLCNTKLPTTTQKRLTCSDALANGSGAAQRYTERVLQVDFSSQHNWRTQALFSVSSPRKGFITML